MMNYEIFKEVVAEKFKDFLPKEYETMEVTVNRTQKVNHTLDGLTLRGDSVAISPSININNMYEQYKECENLDQVISEAAETMERAMGDGKDILASLDMDDVKDHVAFQLVNTQQNEALLVEMPNRAFEDLSIMYRWIIKVEEEGIQSTMITNNLANQFGLNEEELFKLAVENTKRIFPPVVKNMNDVIKEMFVKDGMPPEMVETMLADVPPEHAMYVITNEQGINGAISMLYEDKLHTLAENLGTDLYIMPSSTHEVIAVSSDMGDPEELSQMVAEINMNEVSLEDRLSNQVYHYDKDLRKLTLATDTPNKRIDGIVAEPNLIYDATEKSR